MTKKGRNSRNIGMMVSKKGPVPGLRPLQNGISSHRDRFWTFSRREQKSQENRRYGLRYRLENSEILNRRKGIESHI
ncbi:hypothetical protein MTR_3g010695 [Medicago truncatula]|uniref:Uncharacterized protein n=1 Tax=Medicago truncatula TaxID=3880 RepID=A0A072USX9_MEDTR|nr:hypothetical protein MTR_3g010695 [Medicago truncatula]